MTIRLNIYIKIILTIFIGIVIYSIFPKTTYAQCCSDSDCGGGEQCIDAPASGCGVTGSGYCVSGYETCSGSNNSSSCSSGECCGGNGLCTTDCGGNNTGGGGCYDGCVDCPSGWTISGNPQYNSCSQSGRMCAPGGSAQRLTGCCHEVCDSEGNCTCSKPEYTTYDCCPPGTISQSYTVQDPPISYTNICQTANAYSCWPNIFVSYTVTGASCSLCGRDEERNCNNYGTKTCRPALRTAYRCVPNCSVVAPSVPTLTSPANGACITSTQNSLTWNVSSQTWGNNCGVANNTYSIYVGPNASSLSLYGTTSGSIGNITHNGVSGNNYCWRVRANNGAATTDSAVWCFTINAFTTPWWQVKDGDVTDWINYSTKAIFSVFLASAQTDNSRI